MMTLPIWLQAGIWGLVAGSALVIGAAIGYFTRIPHRVIAAIMSFGSGVAIALGALIDGIPEAIVIGVSMIASKTVIMVAVIAIFLSNIPEGLSSASGMKKAGRSAFYVFSVWGSIALLNGVAAVRMRVTSIAAPLIRSAGTKMHVRVFSSHVSATRGPHFRAPQTGTTDLCGQGVIKPRSRP
jgi:zinc transporter ZupT